MYVRSMSGNDLQAAVTALRAAFEAVAACDVDLLTRPDLVAALDDLETLWCRLPTMSHRLLARLQSEATPQQMGAKSWKEVLMVRWRISGTEANRRLTEAALLAPRQALTGPSLPPLLPATATAQSLGLINGEHVEVIRKAVDKLRGWVDTATREQFEVTLVRTAVGVGPKELKDAADLTLFLLDQDGPEPDDTERARKRGVTKHKQRDDGMVDLSASLTPEAWAVWEAIFAKYAAPGMCNPDDPQPCTSGTPSQAQIDNDHRTLAQRQHDAMLAIGRIALMSGELGHLNGLPVSVIIRTTLQDLESRAGVGTTGGGTVVPIADVIRMAGHANHYLAVFDRATGSALDLFRAKRIASPAQRIMLIARDGGCTKPGCTIGAYGCQAHHVDTDWADGGNTNVDELGLACGPDNRNVDQDNGWTTRMNDQHEVEWIPPPRLETGQARLNYYHQPERLLAPPDDPDVHGASAEPADEADIGEREGTAAPVADETGETLRTADATTSLADVDETRPVEPGSPTRFADNAGEPGGPAPPQNRAA
ncbi:HNH endonuclease signature motif containing protein [Mycolicibacterium litorale]|nr:HNH endonuclease signature motif containing protein [Mycolicibacterium litorale]